MKIKYTETMARDGESEGVALLTGASYVLGSIDPELVREIKTMDHSKLEWSSVCSLFTINGPAGKMVIRFGHLDRTGRFMRLRPPLKPNVYASLPLLEAKPYDPVTFLTQNLNAPVRRIIKVSKSHRPEFIGILIGDETKNYSAFLSWDTDNASLVTNDVEPKKGGGGGREETQVETVPEAVASQTRELLRTIATTYQPDSPHKSNCNTRLRFKPL